MLQFVIHTKRNLAISTENQILCLANTLPNDVFHLQQSKK